MAVIKILSISIFLSLASFTAFAYVGLGPLIPLLGNAVVFVFFFIVAIIGILIYPLKKLVLFFKENNKNDIKKNK